MAFCKWGECHFRYRLWGKVEGFTKSRLLKDFVFLKKKKNEVVRHYSPSCTKKKWIKKKNGGAIRAHSSEGAGKYRKTCIHLYAFEFSVSFHSWQTTHDLQADCIQICLMVHKALSLWKYISSLYIYTTREGVYALTLPITWQFLFFVYFLWRVHTKNYINIATNEWFLLQDVHSIFIFI